MCNPSMPFLEELGGRYRRTTRNSWPVCLVYLGAASKATDPVSNKMDGENQHSRLSCLTATCACHISSSIHTYTHVYIHMYTHAYIHTCPYACTYMYLHMHVHVHVHAHLHQHSHTRLLNILLTKLILNKLKSLCHLCPRGLGWWFSNDISFLGWKFHPLHMCSERWADELTFYLRSCLEFRIGNFFPMIQRKQTLQHLIKDVLWMWQIQRGHCKLSF